MFNQDVIAAVKAAKFCRVVIYPPVRGWCGERVQLEVSHSLDTLGKTDASTGAGHYLVVDGAEEARAMAAQIRGKSVEMVQL